MLPERKDGRTTAIVRPCVPYLKPRRLGNSTPPALGRASAREGWRRHPPL